MGYTYGSPIITNVTYGSVALLTSGYNNADGKGHLYVVNPVTGALIKDISNGSGTTGNPSGLSRISAFTTVKSDGSVLSDVVYGGDLNGDIWRFDISNVNPNNWTVSKLATLKDATGAVQPITAAPSLAMVNTTSTTTKRLVMIGTGKLLENTDLTINTQQSIYGIIDSMDGLTLPASGTLRSILQQQTLTIGAGNIGTATTNSVNWNSKKGWYMDIATGDMINVDTVAFKNALYVVANNPDQTQGCRGAMSSLYTLDLTTGGQCTACFAAGVTQWTSKVIDNAYASSPTIGVTQSGGVVIFIHESDGKVVGASYSPTGKRTAKRVAWKQIIR